MTPVTPDVSIVIVGLNAREYVRQSLASIRRARWNGLRYDVVYVDNGSADGTPAMVRQEFPDVVLLENAVNLGYCRAANQGASRAAGRYLYFLNDDTIVLDDAIAMLVEYMDAHPEAGTVGSRLLYPDGSEQFSGRRFPTLVNGILGRRSVLTRLFPNARWVREYLCAEQVVSGEPFDVDWVSAAGQLVRRDIFTAIGGYAEDYYYWHEAVFCDRIRRAGARVQLHPQSRIVHYEGQGTGSRRSFRAQRFHIVDFHRGAFRCYCQHHGLGWLNPLRWVAAAALGARAACLLAASGVRCGWTRASGADRAEA